MAARPTEHEQTNDKPFKTEYFLFETKTSTDKHKNSTKLPLQTYHSNDVRFVEKQDEKHKTQRIMSTDTKKTKRLLGIQ